MWPHLKYFSILRVAEQNVVGPIISVTKNCEWFLRLYQQNHSPKELAIVDEISELIYVPSSIAECFAYLKSTSSVTRELVS